MKEIIKTSIKTKGPSLLWGSVIFLLFSLLKAVGEALPEGYFGLLKSEKLLLPLAISFLLNIIAAFFIVLLLREKPMTLRDGVYWDKEDAPHCPACKTPIQIQDIYPDTNETWFVCVKCKVDIRTKGIHDSSKK